MSTKNSSGLRYVAMIHFFFHTEKAKFITWHLITGSLNNFSLQDCLYTIEMIIILYYYIIKYIIYKIIIKSLKYYPY